MDKVLVLGAGHVAAPLVRYLLEKDFTVTVASRTVSKAEALIKGFSKGKSIELDTDDEGKLDQLIAEHDLAVSLLPYTLHAKVAKRCIENGKHLVTTSYVSEEIKALDDDAKEADIFIMMECGLDPGIDHMSAMKIIHQVENAGGEVTSFESYCGGLPAPESNDNPWGYKFSWSPKGVLLAGKNSAKYLKNGEIIDIPSEELFENNWPMEIEHLSLEAYPNRNSLPYKETYGLDDADTVFRGTLRYPGWCKTMKCMVDLGWLDDKEMDLSGMTYADLMKELAGDKAETAEFLDIPIDSDPIKRMEWLGLFDEEPLPMKSGSPIGVLVDKMQERMDYEEGEKDMIVLHHIFKVEYPSGTKTITSTLIDKGVYGEETSMARTVALPAAIATEMILKGKITGTGVHIPVAENIYEPILEKLEDEDIVFQEKIQG